MTVVKIKKLLDGEENLMKNMKNNFYLKEALNFF
jgi:hypothetical protein